MVFKSFGTPLFSMFEVFMFAFSKSDFEVIYIVACALHNACVSCHYFRIVTS